MTLKTVGADTVTGALPEVVEDHITDDLVAPAVAAEAALARNADNLNDGLVADNLIPASIARDTEVAAAVAEAVGQEITDRSAADTALAGSISAEAGTRAAADAALDLRLDNLEAHGIFMLPAPTGVAATDWAVISAAHAAAKAAVLAGGSGIVVYPGSSTKWNIGSHSIPIDSGVKHIGQSPILNQSVFTPGTYLADGAPTFAGGTGIQGDGTAPIFWDGETDQSSPSTTTLGKEKSGVAIKGFLLDNCTYGVRIGAKNVMGVKYSEFDNLYVTNASVWGYEFKNFVHNEFGRLYAWLCQGAGRWASEMDLATYQGGNSNWRELYGLIPQDARDRRLCRGWVFEAKGGTGSNGGAMNECVIDRAQFNAYNVSILTETVTLTNASSNVAVADGTKYLRGMLVKFATSAGGFTAGLVYVVQSVSSNNIVLGTSKTGGTVTANAGTTVSMSSYGFAGIEVTADDANSHVTSIFIRADVEGNSSAGIYAEGAQRSTFELGSGPSNSLQGWVLRSVTHSECRSFANVSIDFDSNSSTTSFFGTRNGMVNRQPRGLFFDSARSTHGLQIGLAQSGVTAPDFESAVQGWIRPNNGNGEIIRTRDADLTLSGLWVGTIVHASGSGHTFTLPTLADSAPNSSLIGEVFDIVNTGAGTLTVNTDGTQLFNQVGAKTSLSVTQGNRLRVVGAKNNSGTFFWIATAHALA